MRENSSQRLVTMELDREAALSYSAFEFVGNPADDLKCLICSKVATEPDRHESCGKIFCRDCLVRNGKDEPCPSCKQEKPVFSLDKESKFSDCRHEAT